MVAMKTVQPLLLRQPNVEAYAASALDWLGWIMNVIASFAAPHRSRRLVRFVQLCERGVEAIIFLMAVARLAPPPQPRAVLPANAPAGFRRTPVKDRRRLLFKHARIRLVGASLYQRVLRLISALANPAPYIARFMARLRKRLRATTIILTAPPACALAAGVPNAPKLWDDS
jgi:hypothetical protein